MIEFLVLLTILFLIAMEISKRQENHWLSDSLDQVINDKLSEKSVYKTPIYSALLQQYVGDKTGKQLFKKVYALHCLIQDKDNTVSYFFKKKPQKNITMEELTETFERLINELLSPLSKNLPNRASSIHSVLLRLTGIGHGSVLLCISNLKNTLIDCEKALKSIKKHGARAPAALTPYQDYQAFETPREPTDQQRSKRAPQPHLYK